MVKLREFYKDQLSKDYERLWGFLMNGFEVVVFLHNKENRFHSDIITKAFLVEHDEPSPILKITREVIISSQGISYFNTWENQPKSWKEIFIDYCKEKDLAFIDTGIF